MTDKERIEQLEAELALYKEDSMAKLYASLNKKLISLSEAIDNASIDLTSKDDKVFERLMKAMVESKSIAENLKWLKQELKITEEVETNRRDPLRERAGKK